MVVGGQKVPTWAYVMKEPDGTFKMVVLDKDTLQELDSIPFDGKFATADREGDEIIIVSHTVADADTHVDKSDGGAQLADSREGADADSQAEEEAPPDETFRLTRLPTDQFVGGQATQ